MWNKTEIKHCCRCLREIIYFISVLFYVLQAALAFGLSRAWPHPLCVNTEKTNSSVGAKQIENVSVNINSRQKGSVIDNDVPVQSVYSLLLLLLLLLLIFSGLLAQSCRCTSCTCRHLFTCSSQSSSYNLLQHLHLSLIHIWRCRRIERCRSRWSPYH